jgi:hypothetical protein
MGGAWIGRVAARVGGVGVVHDGGLSDSRAIVRRVSARGRARCGVARVARGWAGVARSLAGVGRLRRWVMMVAMVSWSRIFGMALLVGCEVDRSLVDVAEAGGDGETSVQDAGETPDGSSDDASATASDEGSSPSPLPGRDSPYPYCESKGGYELYCPPTVNGHGFINWHVEGDSSRYCDGKDCNACLCMVACIAELGGPKDPALCPVPTSGTAVAECFDPLSLCYLTCDDGETCPDGMTCVHELEIEHFVCAWVTE